MKGATAARASAREGGLTGSRSTEGEPGKAAQTPDPIRALHRVAGNAAVGDWLRAVGGANNPNLALRALSGPGQALEPGVRREMEGRFGEDFGSVRVHRDVSAMRSASAERARAYTIGERIVLGRERSSGALEGRALLAHELAHVIQQRRAGSAAGHGGTPGAERGADQAAAAVATGGPVRPLRVSGGGGLRISRAPDDDPGHAVTASEWGKRYQKLRELEERADVRSDELQREANRNREAQWRAQQAGKASGGTSASGGGGSDATATKPGAHVQPPKQGGGKAAAAQPKPRAQQKADPGKYPFGGDVTMGAGFSVDDAGKVRQVVGSNTGQRYGASLKPDENWAGTAGKGKDPRQGHEERHFLRNPRGEPITSGAGRPHCVDCAKAIELSGATTASDRKNYGPRWYNPTKNPLMTESPANQRKLEEARKNDPKKVERWQREKETEEKRIRALATPHHLESALERVGKIKDDPGGISHHPPEVVHQRGGSGVAPAATAHGTFRIDEADEIRPGVYRRKRPGAGGGTGHPAPGSGGAHTVPGTATAHTTPATGTDHPAAKMGSSHADAGTGTKPPPSARTRAHPGRGTTDELPAPGTGGRNLVRTTGTSTSAAGTGDIHPPPHPDHDPQTRKQTAPAATGASQHALPATNTASATHSTRAAQGSGDSHQEPKPQRKPPSPPLPKITPPTSVSPKVPPADTGGSGTAATGLTARVAPSRRTAGGTGHASASGRSTPQSDSQQAAAGKPGTRVGWKEIAKTKGREQRFGSTVAADANTTALSRDSGRLGVGRTVTHTAGQQDDQGNLVRGRETSRGTSGGLIARPGGIGGFGSAGASATQARGKGFTTNQAFGVDGSVIVNVSPVSGSSPTQYRLHVVMTLGGHATVGGGVERGRVGGNVSASVQGSVTGSFEHTYTQQEVDAYLGALKDPKKGGADKEFRIMRLATQGSLPEAKALLGAAGAAAMAPSAIAKMAEGDTADVTVQGGGELGAGVHGQGSVVGIGLGVSFSRSGSLRRIVTIKDAKALVTVEVLANKGVSAGGAVSVFSVEAGAGYGKVESTGESVTFSLDPTDAADLKKIAAVDTANSLRALAATPGGAAVISRSQSHDRMTSSNVSVGAPGGEAKFGSEHSRGDTQTVDNQGQVITEHRGSSGGGLEIGAKDGPKLGVHETDSVTLGANPGNQGYGDVNTVSSHTDATKTLGTTLSHPVTGVLGAATGGTPVIAQTTQVVGMKLGDADFKRLTAAAADPNAWSTAFTSSGSLVNQSLDDAHALRHKVLAANGDRDAIARAFADYASDNDYAAKFVQKLVRPYGTTEGGRRYDWPEGFDNEKVIYESLVLGDPGADADSLVSAGKTDEAVGKLEDAIKQLQSVASSVDAGSDNFSDHKAVSEMLGGIRKRQRDLRTKIRQLQPQVAPAAAKQDPANRDPAKAGHVEAADQHPAQTPADSGTQAQQPVGPDPATVDRDKEQIRDLIKDTIPLRRHEQEVFAKIDAEYDHWYRGPDIYDIFRWLNELHDFYAEWDKDQITPMKDLYKEIGQDANMAMRFSPDRAGWRKRRSNPALTNWGTGMQMD